MPVLTAFALLLSLALPLAAQNPNRPLDMAIDASVRTRVIDGVLGRLNEGYVFPQIPPRWRERFARSPSGGRTTAS